MQQDSKSVLAQDLEQLRAVEQDGGKPAMFPLIDSLSAAVAGDAKYCPEMPPGHVLPDMAEKGKPLVSKVVTMDQLPQTLAWPNEGKMSETDVVTRRMPTQPNRATRRKAAKRAKKGATYAAPRNGRWFHTHR